MPVKVSKLPRNKSVLKFDVDKVLDGNVWKLTKGVDFDCTPLSLRSVMYAKARAQGKKVTVQFDPNDIKNVFVQLVVDTPAVAKIRKQIKATVAKAKAKRKKKMTRRGGK